MVHLALVYDGQSLTLYRNGNQCTLGGRIVLTVHASLLFPGYTGALQIGTMPNMSADRNWHGLIDDVAVFTGALAEAQVQTVMSGDFSAFIHPHPQLTIAPSGGKAVLTWLWGILQSASDVTATWQDETKVVSPTMVSPTWLRRFYRIRH